MKKTLVTLAVLVGLGMLATPKAEAFIGISIGVPVAPVPIVYGPSPYYGPFVYGQPYGYWHGGNYHGHYWRGGYYNHYGYGRRAYARRRYRG